MARTVLVTGVNGFVGGHLVAELNAHGYDVVGTAREDSPRPAVASGLSDYVAADLATTQLAAAARVDAVIHLAGLAAVGPSFGDPVRYLHDNSAMLVHLCEPLVDAGSDARVVVVSTGAVYDSRQPMPINESGRISQSSPYVVSKLAVEELARYYAHRGLHTTIARPFNHIGPGQGEGFLVPDLLAGLRTWQREARPVVTGNLRTARDYTDVRDVAAAYRLMIETATQPGAVFNVASGRAVTGMDILAALTAALGLGDVPTEIDPQRVRPTDAQLIVGNADALRRHTAWSPSFSLGQTLTDIVSDCA